MIRLALVIQCKWFLFAFSFIIILIIWFLQSDVAYQEFTNYVFKYTPETIEGKLDSLYMEFRIEISNLHNSLKTKHKEIIKNYNKRKGDNDKNV